MKKNLIIITLSLLMLNGCSNQKIEESDSFDLITSNYALEFIANEIVKNTDIRVENISSNVDVHHKSLTPKDTMKIINSDLTVLIGEIYEPFFEVSLFEGAENLILLEDKLDLELREMNHSHMHEHDDEHKGEDHEDEHHDDNEGEDHEEHSNETVSIGRDPHFWFSEERLLKSIDIISAELGEKLSDESTKTLVINNAMELKKSITSMFDKYRKGLKNCEFDFIVTSHNAHSYLANDFGFNIDSILGLSTLDEPSLNSLVENKKLSLESGFILAEDNNLKDYAKTISENYNIEILPIHALEYISPNEKRNFIEIMEDNLNSFKTALKCN